MPAQNKVISGLLLAITLLCGSAAGAETLQGQVEVIDQPMRLSRQGLHAATTVQTQSNPLQGTTSASDFASAPMQQQQPSLAALPAFSQEQARLDQAAQTILKSLANTASGGINQNQQMPRSGRSAPYVWSQSMQGGYHDASGNISQNVNADKLYLYGGKFSDGTPVPPTPIPNQNAFGHAYKQGSLSSGIFWDH